MDEENAKSWAAQPDVCRCCLSTSGSLDLTASYTTEAGVKEVFYDMLVECFGITLSYLSEWGPSRLVCGLCVGHLRDACSFRRQLLRAEEYFVDFCSNRDDFLTVDSLADLKSHSSAFQDLDVASNDVQDTRANRKPEKEHRKRKKQKIKTKRNCKAKNIDYDSDVPIAELSKKKVEHNNKDVNAENLELSICNTKENELKHVGNEVDVLIKGQPHTERPKTVAKQISERKRVILTCSTVLRDTTACPFRHHKSWFQCFFCTQDFMELNLLRKHTLENHNDIDKELKGMKRYPRSLQIDISNLECRHCNVSLTDVNSMRRHLVETHNKVIYNECIADYKVDSSPYSCHLCKQEFHVFRTLTTHLNEHYANCICDVCGRSFLNSKRLKVHKRTHEIGLFPCSECGKILKTKSSIANHIESAHSKRIIKCQICFKPMKHYNDRIKHMSEVHDITHTFKCPICFKEYNIKHYLATHIRQTHGNKNKKCTKCGMAFITNHGLKKHMWTHTGEKPYACHICSKAYARNDTLREHMRGHQNETLGT